MGYSPLTYERIVAGTAELIARGGIEIFTIIVTSENGEICDLVLYDAATADNSAIAVHIAAEENATNSITFPSDAPLVLENGTYASLNGTSGRAFVYYR